METNCRLSIGFEGQAKLPDLTKYISELLQGPGNLCLKGISVSGVACVLWGQRFLETFETVNPGHFEVQFPVSSTCIVTLEATQCSAT